MADAAKPDDAAAATMGQAGEYATEESAEENDPEAEPHTAAAAAPTHLALVTEVGAVGSVGVAAVMSGWRSTVGVRTRSLFLKVPR